MVGICIVKIFIHLLQRDSALYQKWVLCVCVYFRKVFSFIIISHNGYYTHMFIYGHFVDVISLSVNLCESLTSEQAQSKCYSNMNIVHNQIQAAWCIINQHSLRTIQWLALAIQYVFDCGWCKWELTKHTPTHTHTYSPLKLFKEQNSHFYMDNALVGITIMFTVQCIYRPLTVVSFIILQWIGSFSFVHVHHIYTHFMNVV